MLASDIEESETARPFPVARFYKAAVAAAGVATRLVAMQLRKPLLR